VSDLGVVATKELDRLAMAFIGSHVVDVSFYGAYNRLKMSVMSVASSSDVSEDAIKSWVGDVFSDWSTHLTNGEYSSTYDVGIPSEPSGETVVRTTKPVVSEPVSSETGSETPPALAEPVPKPVEAPVQEPVVAEVPVQEPVVAPVEVAPVATPLVVTSDMRAEFESKARKMLTAPWMKKAKDSLMVSAMSQLAVYKDVAAALKWFRGYLDVMQLAGVQHGDIDPVTLDVPVKANKVEVKVEKPGPRSIESLLDRSWIGEGMKRVYRSLYQTYLDEDPDGAYDRLAALLDALERAGRAHGDIKG